MARVESEQFHNFDGWNYVVVTRHTSGHEILLNIHAVYPWCIHNPDGSITRFKSESELWEYAIANKLFRKKKGKNTWAFQ